MREETERFFASIVREDRSVIDLLTADYTFVNQRLAMHYGIPNVYGSHFRRIPVTDPARRGLLGQASILTVTSYPNRTSPVVRGEWILENILGTPPGSPPADVPPLEENHAGAAPRSVRERLEMHRANPVCATCHDVMDPLGFALENFDAIGRWRTREEAGPIDATGQLANGMPVDGPVALREAIAAQPAQFAGVLTKKLMTYALGRGVEPYDMPWIREIVRDAAQEDYRFSEIVLGIASSLPFRMRVAEPDGAPTERTAAAPPR
jgi:hypothetical protein